MKKYIAPKGFCLLLSALLSVVAFHDLKSQGLVQAGGFMVINDGAHLVIDGTSGHYYDTLNGYISIMDSGYMHIPGNWTNSSSDHVFTTNDGQVYLYGGNQNIQGSMRTSFPGLNITGSSPKTLFTDALVGGGHGGGGIQSIVFDNQSLILNSRTLIVNNKQKSAIKLISGGVVSETNSSVGYGEVQWNLRNQTGLFSIPFVSVLNEPIPLVLNIGTAGVVAGDSGYIVASTHPTNTTSTPNNRPLPTGVSNTENEYNRENDFKMLDRYWVLGYGNYTFPSSADITFTYLDKEWNMSNGSRNNIKESNLRPIVYLNTINQWDYGLPVSNDPILNQSGSGVTIMEGVWTLSDTTVCPDANFEWFGNCEQKPITFTNLSTIQLDTIEEWLWNFGDGNNATNQNSEHSFTSAGTYNIQLLVVARSGCPDSILKGVNIDAGAIADFADPEEPLVGLPTIFLNQSQNSDRYEWEFGNNGFSNQENPEYIFDSEGQYQILLIANNSGNCPDSISKFITVNQPSLFLLPNSFSPGNSDNLNSTFGLTTLQRVSDYHLVIYNRWGEKIFESFDITQRWDGEYLDNPAMDGTYVYMLSFRDRSMKAHHFKGVVTLLRN